MKHGRTREAIGKATPFQNEFKTYLTPPSHPADSTNKQLEKELQDRERELSEQSRIDRTLERSIQALESELAAKEKARARLEQDIQRTEEKNMKLKQVIDEMMSESTTPTKLGRFASTRSGR